FELDVSKDGTQIRKRGFADVVNRFGGNCFACHTAARPEWDLVCEADHGCLPIPVTRPMIGALQRTDPRCAPKPLSPEDAKALEQAQTDVPRSSLEQKLGFRFFPGAEIDEDIETLEPSGHGGSDAIERGQRTWHDAQRIAGGCRDVADLALEQRIGERDRTHRP